jgi:hypothetical protein
MHLSGDPVIDATQPFCDEALELVGAYRFDQLGELTLQRRIVADRFGELGENARWRSSRLAESGSAITLRPASIRTSNR